MITTRNTVSILCFCYYVGNWSCCFLLQKLQVKVQVRKSSSFIPLVPGHSFDVDVVFCGRGFDVLETNLRASVDAHPGMMENQSYPNVVFHCVPVPGLPLFFTRIVVYWKEILQSIQFNSMYIIHDILYLLYVYLCILYDVNIVYMSIYSIYLLIVSPSLWDP